MVSYFLICIDSSVVTEAVGVIGPKFTNVDRRRSGSNKQQRTREGLEGRRSGSAQQVPTVEYCDWFCLWLHSVFTGTGRSAPRMVPALYNGVFVIFFDAGLHPTSISTTEITEYKHTQKQVQNSNVGAGWRRGRGEESI